MNSDSINEVFAALDPEIWIVTSAHGEQQSGLAATCVVRVSIVPDLPRVLVGISREHETWQTLNESGTFALHLISSKQLDWVWRFGLQSRRNVDKFDGLNIQFEETGAPILTDAPAWLDCRIEETFDIGDRTLFLAEVLAGDSIAGIQPLTIQKFLELSPEEKRQALKEQMMRDAAVDSAAITTWRRARG